MKVTVIEIKRARNNPSTSDLWTNRPNTHRTNSFYLKGLPIERYRFYRTQIHLKNVKPYSSVCYLLDD